MEGAEARHCVPDWACAPTLKETLIPELIQFAGENRGSDFQSAKHLLAALSKQNKKFEKKSHFGVFYRARQGLSNGIKFIFISSNSWSY